MRGAMPTRLYDSGTRASGLVKLTNIPKKANLREEPT